MVGPWLALAIIRNRPDYEDHEGTIWRTVKRNPWATFWSLYACWTIILAAFKLQAGGSVVGIPRFRRDFGLEYLAGSGEFVIPATWQSAFSGAPVAV